MKNVFIDREVLEEMYVGRRMTAEEIGNEFGVSRSCILRRLSKFEIPTRPSRRRSHIYGVWNRRTDELVGIGTRDEMLKITGISRDIFYRYVSYSRDGIRNGRYHIERIEEDDE